MVLTFCWFCIILLLVRNITFAGKVITVLGLEFIRKLNRDTTITLAEKIGVTNPLVSQWESGKKPIPQKRISEIAALYNVKPEYITKELTRLEELTLQKEQLEREIDEATIETDTGFECGIAGAEEALRLIEEDIKEEKLIQGIRNSNTDNYSSFQEYLGDKQSRIQIIKVFLSLCQSKNTSDIFLMSVLRAVERSEDLSDEWGKSNPMESTPSFVDKLCKVMRDQRIEQQKREEQETKEFIDLFGSPDDNDSEE